MPSINIDSTFVTAIPVPSNDEYQKNSKVAVESNYNIDSNYNQNKDMNDHQLSRLIEQGFSRGLAASLGQNNQMFPLRIWIVDNSGSMKRPDGHRIVDTLDSTNVRIVPATRWEEIRECVNYHIRMSTLLEAPTTFRLLNHPGSIAGSQIFSVANNPQRIHRDQQNAIRIMNKAAPTGCTPLTDHILAIHSIVKDMANDLRRQGTKVSVVIATDGLPTDERANGGEYQRRQFIEALRLLEGLPVWVVIRLCTDEDDVVDFYNNLDDELELSLDVLDDFCGEAAEIYEHNPWLNYALPLHRCREMGYHHRCFDLIDERPLTKSDLREFMEILLGDLDGVPDPSLDWMGFSHEIERLLRKEENQWNPMTQRVSPWVDIQKLNRQYGSKNGCSPGCTIM